MNKELKKIKEKETIFLLVHLFNINLILINSKGRRDGGVFQSYPRT